jgi:benzoyl-CoA reductase subunit C
MDINIQILNTRNLTELIEFCKEQAFDLEFNYAKKWKSEQNGRLLVGYMPIYFPREIVHAANGLAVGIMGTGDRKQIIKGDAFYQSYICHIPRGIIELALDGNLDSFDGYVFPSICDVIRNLSGMFKILGKGSFVKYLDYPQNFQSKIGGTFYQNELDAVIQKMMKINNAGVTSEKLNSSIQLYNTNRSLIEEIYNIRRQFPWRLSAEDVYHIVRAGLVLPVEKHNDILKHVLEFISKHIGEPMDKIRVVVTGAFCEQPPINLIKTIEMAGCYIVDDDFLLGSRWIEGDIDSNSDDPVRALSEAYLKKSRFSPSLYNVINKGEQLVKLAKEKNADGIIFAAPSFCDPALLDQPILQKACDDNNIRYISFQYNENTGQFKVIKEQVGAFSDSIKLWEEIPESV